MTFIAAFEEEDLSWQRHGIVCIDGDSSPCGEFGQCVDGQCKCDEHHEGPQCELPRLEICPDNVHRCFFGSKCVVASSDNTNNTSKFECDCSMFDIESTDARILSLLEPGCYFPAVADGSHHEEDKNSTQNAIILILVTACFVVIECLFLRWLELRVREWYRRNTEETRREMEQHILNDQENFNDLEKNQSDS